LEDSILARSFQSEADSIEEAPVPITIHAALYAVVSLLVIAIAWSLVGTVDRIVVAPGKVATRASMIVMQPFTTSRIVRILVKPGDHVRRGQILAEFDPAFAEADQASLEQKVRTLAANIDRIRTELAGGTTFEAGSRASPERRAQAAIFLQEIAGYAAEMAVRDSRARAIDSQLRANRASVSGLHEQLQMARRVTEIRKNLLSQKAGAPLDVMIAQSNEIDFELRWRNAIADGQKLTQQRAEVEAERQSFLQKWRDDLSLRLVQAQLDYAEATETLNKARKLKDLTKMKCPVDAVVLDVADRSAGSVLREAETLVTLVADNAQLYLETNVSARDIGYVHVGDKVRVKFEAFPFQRYGTAEGKLTVLGADSVLLKEGEQSSLVYKAQVAVTDTVASLAARGIRLRPGLVATAEIRTGTRTIASYVLNPILRTTDEGMREP
jgi:HlyD family secretion protein